MWLFFIINCPLKFQYQSGHLKINITPGYFMYMFVHIRRCFQKMFLSPTISFLESCICDYKNLEICWFSMETGVPAAVVLCNWSITQPVATWFCHVVHWLIENLPCIICLWLMSWYFHLRVAHNTRFCSSDWNQQLQVYQKHFFFHKREGKVWLLSAIIF